MKQVAQRYTFAFNSVVGAAATSEALTVGGNGRNAGSLAAVANITVDTNAAKTWLSAAVGTNVITLTAHGYKTGLVCQLTTTGGLPTGLSTSTNYYVIVVDANTISLATTYANAIANTVITFTVTGDSGTGTLTPTALAGATVQEQWSIDGVVWVSFTAATSITTATTYGNAHDRPAFPLYRLAFVITAGSLTVSAKALTYAD